MLRKSFSFTTFVVGTILLLTSLVATASAADHRLARIDAGWDGSQANGGSYAPAISADGRFVVFSSQAANLVKGGQPNELYLYDRKMGTTELVSAASDGSPANNEAYSPAVSADGRFVAFASNATNLAGELPEEIYLRDRKTGKTVLVSGPVDGSLPGADANAPAISADGRYVAFLSFSDNLVQKDRDILPDIYVRDMVTNTLTLVSVSSREDKGNSDSGVAGGAAISSSGRYVAFQSYASNLVPGDTNAAPDVFVHDRQTGKTERISVSSQGKQHAFGTIYDAGGFDRISFSEDGRYITFVSQATDFEKGLKIGDCNYEMMGGGIEPCANVYLHDRRTGKTSILSVSEKNKPGNALSYFPAISPDGRWIAFVSEASNLVPGDTNGQADIFLYHR